MDARKYKDTVYKIIGAAMEVHNDMGWGLLEPLYQDALSIELSDKGVENQREAPIKCYYKNRVMERHYFADILVGDIIVELKSVSELAVEHRAQLFNYLRLTRKPIGLLINFGAESLQGERYAYDEATNECYLIDKNMNPVPR